jgi:arabinan endo-1,5-alpha-L-arabinosidase
MGVDMLEGGGKLFAASRGRHVGPGHFGLLDLGQGVQKFSLHYEADLDRGGVSVLDIRPLLWRDGWPVAGDNLGAGTYTIESARTGTVLELAVQGFPVGGFRPRRGGPPGSGAPPEPREGPPIPEQEPANVASNWPATDRCPTRTRDAASPAEMGDRTGRGRGADTRVRPSSGSRSPARNAR